MSTEYLAQQFEDLVLLLVQALPEHDNELTGILYDTRCETCGELAPGGKCRHHLEEVSP